MYFYAVLFRQTSISAGTHYFGAQINVRSVDASGGLITFTGLSTIYVDITVISMETKR